MIRFTLPRLYSVVLACVVATLARSEAEPTADALGRLKNLTLEELMEVQVSSVSRRPEQWWTAPGAIEILTGEDIRRSGALS